MPDFVPWLIGLALLALLAFLYWSECRYSSPPKPRKRSYHLTYCAWCIHPVCTDAPLGRLFHHADSPVYPDVYI